MIFEYNVIFICFYHYHVIRGIVFASYIISVDIIDQWGQEWIHRFDLVSVAELCSASDVFQDRASLHVL